MSTTEGMGGEYRLAKGEEVVSSLGEAAKFRAVLEQIKRRHESEDES